MMAISRIKNLKPPLVGLDFWLPALYFQRKPQKPSRTDLLKEEAKETSWHLQIAKLTDFELRESPFF